MLLLQNGESYRDGKEVNFLSQSFLLDADVIIVRISSLRKEIDSAYHGNQSQEAHETNKARIEYRSEQFQEYYKHGGSVILVIDDYPTKLIRINGAGRHLYDMVKLFSFSAGTDYGNIEGNNVEISDRVRDLLDGFTFAFKAEIDTSDATTLLSTSKSRKTIGYYKSMNNGFFIALPELHKPASAGKSVSDYIFGFYTDLLKRLKIGFDSIKLDDPDWIAKIDVGEEKTLAPKIELLKAKKMGIEEELKDLTQKTLFYRELKSILYLDGKQLELAVSKCLNALGLQTKVSEGNKSDLIIEDSELNAVVEVKGVSGSGATKYARQLEQWVSERSVVEDKPWKGILILNAFKTLSLDERPSQAFPDDMVKFSVAREHCLILTSDLLKLYNDFEKDLLDSKKIMALLNNTCGIFHYP